MLTINAEIKKDGLRSDATYDVKLRFTLDRKMRRLATSLFVTSKDLTKDLKIKQTSPIRKDIDSLIGVKLCVCGLLKFHRIAESFMYFFKLHLTRISVYSLIHID